MAAASAPPSTHASPSARFTSTASTPDTACSARCTRPTHLPHDMLPTASVVELPAAFVLCAAGAVEALPACASLSSQQHATHATRGRREARSTPTSALIPPSFSAVVRCKGRCKVEALARRKNENGEKRGKPSNAMHANLLSNMQMKPVRPKMIVMAAKLLLSDSVFAIY